jgi:NADP-reducing hydrogenase subunit HndB
MITLDFLKQVDVLDGLDNNRLEQILEECIEKDFKKGEKIFSEQEEAKNIWFVMEGQVDIRFDLPGRSTSEVSTVYSEPPTKTFGWSTFVPPYRYILSAYCASRQCKVAKLEKGFLLKLFESDYEMGYRVMFNIAHVISERFYDMQISSMGLSYAMVKITVHLATCGIAAGAREVMTTLQDEVYKSNRYDIQIANAGCLGKCSTEPNVTVEIEGEEPVVYQHMNPEKMRQIFKEHILNGVVQADFTLPQ